MTSTRSTRWTELAGWCSIGAGLVHASAAGTHSDDRTLVRLFALTALAQAVGGALTLLGSSRRSALLGVIVNTAALGAWAASRTVGLPVVDSLASPEAVGRQDLAAALLAAAAVVGGLWAMRGRPLDAGRSRRIVWLPIVAMAPALLGMAAPHEHDGGSTHSAHSDDAHHLSETGSEMGSKRGSASDDGHDRAEPAPGTTTATLAADPLLAGADTSDATEAQLETAVELVGATRAGASATLTTTAAAEAAGYVWIGDGRRVGGFQHYVHPGLTVDGDILDPDAVESLVFENTPDGPVLVSAMYILPGGSTMAYVPDVAGDLTVWHDHQNLCWDSSGTRLAGVVVNGQCRPGGEQRPTAPMLHVWLVDHDCGPFAGIEGHGAGCDAHAH